MSVVNVDSLRQRYESERPVYEQMAHFVQDELKRKLLPHGISCIFEARAKEVESFLRKALLKSYTSPFEQIKDKAGVRIILTYLDDVEQVKEAISKSFLVQNVEDKSIELGKNQLGYLGIHYEVCLTESFNENAQKSFEGKVCEIQLHTRAQNLWAKVSHELLYKSSHDIPDEIQRNIYRLLALVELIDKEIKDARCAIQEEAAQPDVRMLEQLEKHFYRFTTASFNRELSLEVLERLLLLFEDDEIEKFNELIDVFVENNREKLQKKFSNYYHDIGRNPLLFQPEVFVIFERLEEDPFRLKELWVESFPLSVLESLANIWGTTVELD
ncbi:GTP pyrophosphokinase [Leptolyngbya sp. AN03gr2]|uniref:GTP pyrophosphokinase n=1 Tax=unclassified Leptolyngbya TaxID=2650499 RepID=UPI003D31BD10